MLRTIEIAVKKPLHTTPSIIQFLQQSKSQVIQHGRKQIRCCHLANAWLW